MTKQKGVLAIDFGASGAKAIVGVYNGNKLVSHEVYSFPNGHIITDDAICWDIEYLIKETKNSIKKAVEKFEIISMSIDSWGVDYVLIDKDGQIVDKVYHYRDQRTEGIIEKYSNERSLEEIYSKTGTQLMEINTVFQLYAQKLIDETVLVRADKILLIADYLTYYFTGKKYTEISLASTTGMFNVHTQYWDEDICEFLGIKSKMAHIVESGHIAGKIKKEIALELGVGEIDVIYSCQHDTQSAMVNLPATGKNTAFLSCGTWSLLGIEVDEPIIDFKNAYNTTNEQAYAGKVAYIKNLTGLWIMQELYAELKKEGREYTYDILTKMAEKEEGFVQFIDTEFSDFKTPGNIIEKIESYLQKTYQQKADSLGRIVRIIYDSLAMKYRETILNIESVTNEKIEEIYMVGGGAKASLFCQISANVTGLKVVCGNSEATAIGNILVQLISLGIIENIDEAKKVSQKMLKEVSFEPKDIDIKTAYEKYLCSISRLETEI